MKNKLSFIFVILLSSFLFASEVKNGDSFAFITNHYKGSKMFLLLYTQKRKDTEGKIYYKHYIYQFEVL